MLEGNDGSAERARDSEGDNLYAAFGNELLWTKADEAEIVTDEVLPGMCATVSVDGYKVSVSKKVFV